MIQYNLDKSFIVVTFIKMKSIIALKKAISTFPRGIETISYLEIYNKLSKKENSKNEPSEALISANIIKQINSLLSEPSTTHICYILDIADNSIIERVNNIIEFITLKSTKPVQFEIVSDNSDILEQAKKLNIKTINNEILQC